MLVPSAVEWQNIRDYFTVQSYQSLHTAETLDVSSMTLIGNLLVYHFFVLFILQQATHLIFLPAKRIEQFSLSKGAQIDDNFGSDFKLWLRLKEI